MAEARPADGPGDGVGPAGRADVEPDFRPGRVPARPARPAGRGGGGRVDAPAAGRRPVGTRPVGARPVGAARVDDVAGGGAILGTRAGRGGPPGWPAVGGREVRRADAAWN